MSRPSRLLPSAVLGTPLHKRILHFFGIKTGHDSNMADSHQIGLVLCDHSYDETSKLMWKDRGTAELVEVKVLGPIMQGADAERTFYDAARLLDLGRCEAGQALRIWSGCMSGAKIIALGTRNGRNWPWWRWRQARRLDESCCRDPFFMRGVFSAIAFKAGRNEAWSLLGVPSGSLLRMGELAVNGRRE